MSSNDKVRLIWSLAVLVTIVSLYFAGAPTLLIGALLSLIPREITGSSPSADARRPRGGDEPTTRS